MPDQRLYQFVADKIRNRIMDGGFPIGARLPGERELALEFGVSRVTIREAEIVLQAQGYIRIKSGSGAYVTQPPERRERRIPDISALELTEARLLFESEAAALAASNIDDETLERLDDLLARIAAPGDDATSQDADREFHLTIAAASGNAAVLHTVESLWTMRNALPDVRDVHTAVCVDETSEERQGEHRAVVDALKNRDPIAARRAMQQHFTRLLTSMIDVTEQKAVEELRTQAATSRQRYLNTIAHREMA